MDGDRCVPVCDTNKAFDTKRKIYKAKSGIDKAESRYDKEINRTCGHSHRDDNQGIEALIL